MKRSMVICVGLLLLASPAWAGSNPSTSLAMHVICSDAYLDCTTVADSTFDCEDIDNSATTAEIAGTTYGYVYVFFVAYNFDAITAIEFAITGFPGRSTSWPTPTYCGGYGGTPTMFGNPYDGGGALSGITSEGTGVREWVQGGIFCFGWTIINTNTLTPPFTLAYTPSTYTAVPSVGNKVAGPAPDYTPYVIDTDREHGCTIGGTYDEGFWYYEDCHAPVAAEQTTWSSVKAMYR